MSWKVDSNGTVVAGEDPAGAHQLDGEVRHLLPHDRRHELADRGLGSGCLAPGERREAALPGELDARAADRELSDALAHAAVLDGGPAIKLDALGQPDELLDAAAAAG